MSSSDFYRFNVNVSSNNLTFNNLNETLLFNNQGNETVELKQVVIV